MAERREVQQQAATAADDSPGRMPPSRRALRPAAARPLVTAESWRILNRDRFRRFEHATLS